jgi:hypothetical protein
VIRGPAQEREVDVDLGAAAARRVAAARERDAAPVEVGTAGQQEPGQPIGRGAGDLLAVALHVAEAQPPQQLVGRLARERRRLVQRHGAARAVVRLQRVDPVEAYLGSASSSVATMR